MSFIHPAQHKQVATPTYRIQKEKKSKSDTLVGPSQVTVVGLVDFNQSVTLSFHRVKFW